MKNLIKLILLFGFSAQAETIGLTGIGYRSQSSKFSAPAESETWCDSGAVKNGEVYSLCGVGQSYDESSARERALNLGLEQFDKICRMSSDCADRPRTVEPGRTACATNSSGNWKCWTRVVVTILHER